MEDEIEIGQDEGLVDEEKKRRMKDLGLSEDEADELEDFMTETGLDEDEAMELLNEM